MKTAPSFETGPLHFDEAETPKQTLRIHFYVGLCIAVQAAHQCVYADKGKHHKDKRQ